MTIEEAKARAKWVRELNESGYAGINSEGTLGDRREDSSLYPIAANPKWHLTIPRMLPNEPHPEYFTGMVHHKQ